MRRLSERLVALAIAGAIALNYPVLVLFDHASLILGVPTLYLYLFSAWTVFILLVALAHLARPDPGVSRDERQSP